MPADSGYTVLAPIRHGNLTVFPVVAARSYDTEEFLTLDEGLRSGEVIVTESGGVQPLMRRRRTTDAIRRAGQPVGAGQQLQTAADPAGRRDRDRRETGSGHRQRPHYSGGERSHRSWRLLRRTRPLDGQQRQIWSWRGGTAAGSMLAPMAAPNVRAKAMADKDQQQVWSEVAKNQVSHGRNCDRRGCGSKQSTAPVPTRA